MEHPGVGSMIPALELLDDRGHQVDLALEVVKSPESIAELTALTAQRPRITLGELPVLETTGRLALADWLRKSIDYLRYLDPRYPDRTKLRTRAARRAPSAMLQLGRAAGVFGPWGVAALRRTLQAVERCLAPPAEVERYLAGQRPDVVMFAHLLPMGSRHAEYLRAAKRLGLRTVFPIRGWDNLTNKGLLRDAPDLLLVWNDLQAKEAVELHRVPPGQVRPVGAFSCDHWFGWQPARDRDDFCREVGLAADRPIVLYVCSSGFVAENEVDFVRSWIDRLRARGGVLADAGFLVRPHPLNAAQWAVADLDGPQVRVWPRFGEAPSDQESRRHFFDSIYHAAAVVGINTTAQIESAIVGRPVHTLLAEEFLDTQQGTLHFHYLKADDFGLLHVGRSFDEHAAQLEQSLRGREDDGRNERFLRRFVRPNGLDRAATEILVESIEELAARAAPRPDRGPPLAPIVRAGLAPLAVLAGRRVARRRSEKKDVGTPVEVLRSAVRKRAVHRTGAPVVAGPWLGDEAGELLYWIPFLRWVQTLGMGLPGRLFVVCRARSAAWYAGVGAGRIEVEQLVGAERAAGLAELSEEELQGPLRDLIAQVFEFGGRPFAVLPAGLVADARADLTRQKPAQHPRRRLIEFAPLDAPALSEGLELPAEFVAVRLDADVAASLEQHRAVVMLDSLDGRTREAVLARSHGFVGTYGIEAVEAVLLGVPAVVLPVPAGGTEAGDVELVRTYLASPPFGPLHVLEAPGGPDEVAAQAERLLSTPAASLAGV